MREIEHSTGVQSATVNLQEVMPSDGDGDGDGDWDGVGMGMGIMVMVT